MLFKEGLTSRQQYVTHNNAARVRPEALAERYEGGINSETYLNSAIPSNIIAITASSVILYLRICSR